ncbi:MAG: sigma-70 family RNA polymerase sigma factor [Magnetococcales bacterium]|nr:sigma-70 family RNA polymerase sigma factor [Magnetococcales bacterium]MBF0151403.1 sigma-70 family RNA polymerase sigma factor [Magnetococcales bacterium]MBF0174335.1 sigma-70 family RNA polymerase sigma factor [Magnetococcales bacterium]MBF0348198.1 sigma-70 family RNA polymerase sigma factor [Magnetococcales bacterium]MBF0632303.1 sigma-70 family RNA polymerase sigma factor [Magnetococcales bacterium]
MVHSKQHDPSIQADAQLMARVAMGDAAAWKLLADRELSGVLLLAKRLLDHHQEAEDVTQETFTRLWRQAPHWREEARVRTWLYRVTCNLCLDHLRHRHGRITEETFAEGEEEAVPASDRESPLAHLERKEQRHLLDAALAHLPVHHRTAVLLVNVLGLRVAEAAQVMHLGDEAMASLLARSRQRLRLLLLPWRNELLGA